MSCAQCHEHSPAAVLASAAARLAAVVPLPPTLEQMVTPAPTARFVLPSVPLNATAAPTQTSFGEETLM